MIDSGSNGPSGVSPGTRHFTPKHASWLNQIECWFSILGRQDDLAAKLDAYVAWYLETDQPFRWADAGRKPRR